MDMDKRTVAEPLKGKRFFLDPKLDKNMSLKIKESIELLGGKVEAFLDKTIHFAITNEVIVKKDKAKLIPTPLPMSNSPFGTTSQSSCKNGNVVNNRWKDLARRANTTRTTTSTLNNVLNTAKILGIKIRHVDEVWSWLKKKTEKTKSVTSTSVSTASKRPNEIVLKHPCIKLEDPKCKPIFEEFECFPYFESLCKGDRTNDCPILLTKTTENKSSSRKKSNEQKGYCECCRSSYLNNVKHRKSVQHINYGENDSHFAKLDQYIARNNLGFEMFLKRELQNLDSPSKNLRSSNLKTPEKQLQTTPVNQKIPKTLTQSDRISSPTSKRKNSTAKKSLVVAHRYPLRSPKTRNTLSNTTSPTLEKLSHSSKRKHDGEEDSIADCVWTRLDFTPEKPASKSDSNHTRLKSDQPNEYDLPVAGEVECFLARKRLRSFTKLNEAIRGKTYLTSATSNNKMMQLLHTSEQEASEFFGF